MAEILAQFDTWAGVRRGPVIVTHVEPLVDVIVHSQDIVRPLGRVRRRLPTPRPWRPTAAGCWRRCRAAPASSAHPDAGHRHRMGAGRGPIVEGPILELLMLCSGREPDGTVMTGDGASRPGYPPAGQGRGGSWAQAPRGQGAPG